MSELRQGENYEPDVEETTESSGSKQRPAKKMGKPFKAPEIGNSPLAGVDIDPKYIAVGIVIFTVLVAIIMLLVVKPFGKKKQDIEETVWETAAMESESSISSIEGLAPTGSVETLPAVQATNEAGLPIQETDASGNLVTDANGNPVYETLPQETIVTAPDSLKYSDKELNLLRKYGYTADEIEQCAKLGIKAKVLLEDAKSAREKLAYDTINKLGDSGSPEFQEIYYNTWLQGQPRSLINIDPNIIPVTASQTVNVDYTRLPAKGMQLWVKLKLPDGEYVFMSVTPNRYVKLNDTGNMVVTINTITQGDQKWVVSITEEEVERDDSVAGVAP